MEATKDVARDVEAQQFCRLECLLRHRYIPKASLSVIYPSHIGGEKLVFLYLLSRREQIQAMSMTTGVWPWRRNTTLVVVVMGQALSCDRRVSGTRRVVDCDPPWFSLYAHL